MRRAKDKFSIILIIIFIFGCGFNIHAKASVPQERLNISVKKGDVITFGSFSPIDTISQPLEEKEKSQDNKAKDPEEDLEWQVLTVKNGKALCISRYAVDTRMWQLDDPNDHDNHYWDTCSLREWLNHDFYSNAFSDEEKKCITVTHVPALYNEYENDVAGKATYDKVFLLSVEEVKKYMPTEEERKLSLPPYGKYRKYSRYLKENRVGAWFLRNPGSYGNATALVHNNGFIDTFGGCNANEIKYDVRPVIWINVGKLSKDTPDPIPEKEIKSTGKAKKYKEGDIILLGKYEQDIKTEEQEDIEWLIIKKEGNKALVISRYVLDRVMYFRNYTTDKELTWKSSYMRAWLNGTFYKKAFDDSERKLILESKVGAQDNPYYPQTYQGQDSNDRIFLLSAAETRMFISEPKDRGAKPTRYAKSKELVIGTDGNAWWWLRTMSYIDDDDNERHVMYVETDATIPMWGKTGHDKNIYKNPGVRPAMWIDLSSEDLIITGNVNKEREPTPSVKLTADNLATMKPGNIVTFGRYEQDNDTRNGQEDIRWIVMGFTEDESCLVLLAEDVIDYQCYHPFEENVCEKISWHDAAVRKWLNKDFINKAFTKEEQGFISPLKVDEDCVDRVTLLSSPEIFYFAEKYPILESSIIAKPSKYVKANLDSYTDIYYGSTYWICRTRDADDTGISFIDGDGNARRHGGSLGPYYIGVRPAIIVTVPDANP